MPSPPPNPALPEGWIRLGGVGLTSPLLVMIVSTVCWTLANGALGIFAPALGEGWRTALAIAIGLVAMCLTWVVAERIVLPVRVDLGQNRVRVRRREYDAARIDWARLERVELRRDRVAFSLWFGAGDDFVSRYLLRDASGRASDFAERYALAELLRRSSIPSLISPEPTTAAAERSGSAVTREEAVELALHPPATADSRLADRTSAD